MSPTLSHGLIRMLRTPLACPAAALFVVLLLGLGCGSDGSTPPDEAPNSEATAFSWPEGANPRVTLEVADMGAITVELYPELAPETVANFLKLAGQGFYEGTTFHRVIPGFMIQGGDPNSRDNDPRNDGDGGPGYSIPDEMNGAPHSRGTLSMANTGSPNSAGSQFFIIHQDSPELDGRYTAFGRVVQGIEIVDRIAAVEVDLHGRWGKPNRPLTDVVISKMTLSRAPVVTETETGTPEPTGS